MNKVGEEHEGALKGNRERRRLLIFCYLNTTTKSTSEQKGLLHLPAFRPILKQSQGQSSSRTWGQELKQRLLEALWSLHSYRSQGVM